MSLHDPGMARGSRWIGVGMTAGSIVLLLQAPETFSPWHFTWFLAWFVGGLLLAFGFVLLPSRLEPSALAESPSEFRPAAAAARPPAMPLLCYVATLLAAGLVVLGLALAAVGTRLFDTGPLDLVPVAGLPLVTGTGLLLYLWRHDAVRVVADDDGLHVRGYLRRFDASWDEVEHLSVRREWLLSRTSVYSVQTRHGTASFGGTWPGADALAAQVAGRSRRDWVSRAPR